MSSNNIFQYSEYCNFLKYLKTLGPITTFSQWKGDNSFLIRHDVDLDLSLALKLARLEEDNDVVSTFFILTTCPTYNILSRENSSIIKELSDMGFEIGLHFDPSSYGKSSPAVLREKFDEAINLLSSLVNKEVRSFSTHTPGLQDHSLVADKYINAYDKKIFYPECYISDSQMNFRGQMIYEFVKNIKYRTIQILLHPMHYSETGSGYSGAVQDHVLNYLKIIDDSFSVNPTYCTQTADGYTISYVRGSNAHNFDA